MTDLLAVLVRPPEQGAAPVWNAERDGELLLRAIWPETHDVETFVFSAPEPRTFRYLPGQFLTFEFDVDGETIHRCYTLASPPTRPDTLSITVKRRPGGAVSPFLHDRLAVGARVRATGPHGVFSAVHHPAEKYLFLSDGSGVTPLMSMTRTFHDLGADPDILFVHFARTPAEIVFRAELDLIAARTRRLRLVHVPERAGEGGAWQGPTGLISCPLLETLAADLREREAFVCGPAAFLAAARAILAEIGLDGRRYHQESFDFAGVSASFDDPDPCPTPTRETAPPPGAEPAAAGPCAGAAEPPPPAEPGTTPAVSPALAPATTYGIRFDRSGRIVACDGDTFILTAARADGLRPPSSCTKGICGACKTRKLSGEVAMTHAGGIRQREIDAGMILLCCSRPLSDVVIDR